VNRYRLVALDIDGTLLTSDKRITDRSQRALETLYRRGVRVCLITGRNLPMARKIADLLAIPTSIVAHNGSVVFDSGAIVASATLSLDTARAVVGTFRRWECFPMVYTSVNGVSRLLHEPSGWNRTAGRYLNANRDVLKTVESLDASLSEAVEVLHIVAVEPERRVLRVLDDDAVHDGARLMTSGGYGDGECWFLEAMATTASKTRGLSLIAGRYGVTLERVVAVGDNLNDVDLLGDVGLGVAMGNAPDPVKAVARFTTASNDEDGVALALERVFRLDGRAMRDS
jgi:hypothetical protein